ncbi:MAG: Hsp20/alpha crystallin family protein [Anaerolineae bacterium]
MSEGTSKRKRRTGGDTSPHRSGSGLDLGFGDLFKGLSGFLDVVSDLAEKAEQVQERQGEFTLGKTASGKPIRGVYGFTVRTAAGGMPTVEQFGNIRESESGPVVADVREPLADVFDEDGSVLVVLELPGVAENEIELAAEQDILTLRTTGQRRYEKEVLLPAVVDATTMTKSYTNGILEVRAQKAGTAEQQSGNG